MYHACPDMPVDIEITTKTDSCDSWSLCIDNHQTDIEYCPYCGKHLPDEFISVSDDQQILF